VSRTGRRAGAGPADTSMLNPIFRLATPASLGVQAIAFSLHSLDNRHYGSGLRTRLGELREQLDIAGSRQRM